MSFGNVASDAGLASLNQYLESRSFIDGYENQYNDYHVFDPRLIVLQFFCITIRYSCIQCGLEGP